MSGKLIVIDGLDGCGKSTQTEAVFKKLKSKNDKVMLTSYPDYESDSSALVRMYLNGKLSKDPEDINAYAASSFYAVDRYASFKMHWEKEYHDGYTIIASRYTTSNAIHQMGKLLKNEWDQFLDWLYDYEYNKLGLPKPDKVIFLDMDRDVADNLIKKRYNGDESKKDIHEQNIKYLEKCRESALYTAKKDGWTVINCSDEKNPYPVEDITKSILSEINS